MKKFKVTSMGLETFIEAHQAVVVYGGVLMFYSENGNPIRAFKKWDEYEEVV